MSLKGCLSKMAFLLPLAVGALSASPVLADGACAAGGCGVPAPSCAGHPSNCCYGPYVHYTPKVPCLKFKCTCGKPVCDLCDLQGYGYYPTCWRAWDQPLNYACAVPTPTQMVHPPVPMMPGATDPATAPMPRMDRR